MQKFKHYKNGVLRFTGNEEVDSTLEDILVVFVESFKEVSKDDKYKSVYKDALIFAQKDKNISEIDAKAIATIVAYWCKVHSVENIDVPKSYFDTVESYYMFVRDLYFDRKETTQK